MRYLVVKNYEKYQHYKSPHAEAAPAWIKLYRGLLSDYEFSQLPDAGKAHLMLIWLQASQTKGRIPYDARWIADKIGAASKVDLDCLIAAGFLTLECFENTTIESNRENGSSLVSSSLLNSSEGESEGKPNDDRFEASDLMDAWNEYLTPVGLPKVDMLSATRKAKAAKRLAEHPEDTFWSTVMHNIQNSTFLRGLSKPRKPDERPFKASFDWLIDNDTNVVKVYEGRYNGNG